MKEYRTLGAEHSSAKQEPPVFDDFPPVIGCCELCYRSRVTKGCPVPPTIPHSQAIPEPEKLRLVREHRIVVTAQHKKEILLTCAK